MRGVTFKLCSVFGVAALAAAMLSGDKLTHEIRPEPPVAQHTEDYREYLRYVRRLEIAADNLHRVERSFEVMEPVPFSSQGQTRENVLAQIRDLTNDARLLKSVYDENRQRLSPRLGYQLRTCSYLGAYIKINVDTSGIQELVWPRALLPLQKDLGTLNNLKATLNRNLDESSEPDRSVYGNDLADFKQGVIAFEGMVNSPDGKRHSALEEYLQPKLEQLRLMSIDARGKAVALDYAVKGCKDGLGKLSPV